MSWTDGQIRLVKIVVYFLINDFIGACGSLDGVVYVGRPVNLFVSIHIVRSDGE